MMSLCSKKLSLAPATAVFHLRGRLENSGFPWQSLVRKFCNSVVGSGVNDLLRSILQSDYQLRFLDCQTRLNRTQLGFSVVSEFQVDH